MRLGFRAVVSMTRCICSGSIANFLDFLVHSSLNWITCRLKFLGLFLLITFLCSLLDMIPLLLMMVAYRLLAMIAPSVLLVRTLYSVRQDMRLQLSLPMSLCLILDLLAIKVSVGLTLLSGWTKMSLLNMRECIQRVALLKVRLLFPSVRFRWSWKMGKRGSLPVRLRIVISTSIRGLVLGPGVPVCNDGYGM